MVHRISDVFDQLALESASNDRRSSCILGRALARCHERPKLSMALRRLESEAADLPSGSDAEGRLVARAVAVQAEIEALDTLCGGIARTQITAASRYMIRAAELGDAETAVAYVLEPPLPANVLDDIEGWRQYREQVWGLLTAAAEAGNVRALYLAMGVAAGTDRIAGMSQPIVEPNPALALEYALTLEPSLTPRAAARLAGQTALLRSQLTEAAQKRADDLADARRARMPIGEQKFDPFFDMAVPAGPEHCAD